MLILELDAPIILLSNLWSSKLRNVYMQGLGPLTLGKNAD